MSSSHNKELSFLNTNYNTTFTSSHDIGQPVSLKSLVPNPYADPRINKWYSEKGPSGKSISIDNLPIPKNEMKARKKYALKKNKKKSTKKFRFDKKKTNSLIAKSKKRQEEMELERKEKRDRMLRRFTKKENRKRNTYFNKSAAKNIQRVWRGSKTRKSNNLHKRIHQKIKQYNNNSRWHRNNVESAQKEKRQALKYKARGYGKGNGQRDPTMEYYNNTTIAYADSLEIDAGKSLEILNKKRKAAKKLLKKQKYGQYLKPTARAKRDKELGLGRSGSGIWSQNAAQNLENETRSAYYAEHSNPSFVQHSPGIYEEEGETYNTFGWGGRRKTRRKHKKRKHKRKSRKKKK